MYWRSCVRYILLAYFTLFAGGLLNLVIGGRSRFEAVERSSFVELWLLLALYAGMHAMIWGVSVGVGYFLEAKVRVISIATTSIVFFVGSLLLYDPRTYQGLHIFVIFLASLVVITLDNLWRSYSLENLVRLEDGD
jgi:hypothetical protein